MKPRVVLLLLLLFMILSRMIWVQLRRFDPEPSPAAAIGRVYIQKHFPTICPGESPPPPSGPYEWLVNAEAIGLGALECNGALSRWFNIALLLAICWLLVVATRILTPSWVLALGAGATVLSRGAFLNRLEAGPELWILTLIVTLWMAMHVHFIRTGSTFSLLATIVVTALAALWRPILAGLALVVPLSLLLAPGREPFLAALGPWNRRLASFHPLFFSVREQRLRSWNAERGRFWRSTVAPFALWIAVNRRKRNLALLWVGSFLLIAGAALYTREAVMSYGESLRWPPLSGLSAALTDPTLISFWLQRFLEPVDAHFLLSLGFVGLVAGSVGTADRRSFALASVTLFVALILFAILSYLSAGVDYWLVGGHLQHLTVAPVLVWWEPLVIGMSFGALGSYVSVVSLAANRDG